MDAWVMSGLLLAGLGPFAWTARRRWRLMRVAAAPDPRWDRPGERWAGVLRFLFGQARMFRYPAAGIAHAAIFAGFVVLLLRTLILFARPYAGREDFGFWLFDDATPAGRAYLLLKDLIGLAVVLGVAYFLYLRLGPRPARMEHGAEGLFILLMILGIVVSDMLYDAAGIAAAGADPPAWTPGAALLSAALRDAPPGWQALLRAAGFWTHAALVLAFLNFLPYGKHFHVLTVLPNIYFRALGPRGRLEPIADIEQRIERGQTLGVAGPRDLSWKDVLDLYTCTECGRCSDHCPATRTGKLLSPKHLTMALRNHLYAREHDLLAGGPRADEPFVPASVDPQVIFACTTCGACETECPVFISYVDKIVDLRRHMVMERGEMPAQWQTAFRGMETVGNPYGLDNTRRADWAEGLDVPRISERPQAEYLFWVGCAPSFDDRSRRIARALVGLLRAAGVDFAILGAEEQCTGDPARRAGNEYLFAHLAQANCQTLRERGVRRIVTTCPHCFNTLRNEYPDFGGQFEVVHHTQLLAELLRSGRLRPARRVEATVAYHDSCYLGRYHDIYDPPREILRAIPGVRLVEPTASRDRGMCCGAGGAQMWKEEEPVSREKVNHARARQILPVLPAGGPRAVASACPFCKTMLSDALVDLHHEDIEQRDVAELLWQAVQPAETPAAAESRP